jgi:hypothetical protein
MHLTDASIRLAAAKTPASGASVSHCKALAGVLFGLKWLTIDFRVNFADAFAGISKSDGVKKRLSAPSLLLSQHSACHFVTRMFSVFRI